MSDLLFDPRELDGAEPLPLSSQRRAEVLDLRRRMLAGELAPLIVEPITDLLAERFAQNVVPTVSGRVGYQELIRGDTPAAGSHFRYVVPGQHVLFPLSVFATFTTSAALQDRTLAVEYQDADGQRYLIGGAPNTVGAGDSRDWVWYPNAGASAWPVEDAVISPLPQQHLYPGNALVVRIGNADVGDQLSRIRISAWLYPTGPVE